MSDLDARVAALMKHVDALHPLYGVAIKPLGLAFFRANIENAIRAELQKPALHEPVTDAEVHAARQILGYKSGQVRPMLESFLQGRAKPALQANAAAVEPGGWKLVPVELTEEMKNAWGHDWDAVVWAELLSAAPSPVPARAQEVQPEPKTCDTCQVALSHYTKHECDGCTAPDGTMTHWRPRWSTTPPNATKGDEVSDANLSIGYTGSTCVTNKDGATISLHYETGAEADAAFAIICKQLDAAIRADQKKV